MIRIVRMMAVYNEIDILPRNLDWYHDAGIETICVDNGSTDGSYEYCQQALSDGRIMALDRLITKEFEWRMLLKRLLDIAQGLRPDWLMLTAPDEFFETADGTDLGRALRLDIERGFNLIKFYNMEFWMTDRDDPDEPDPLTRMQYYSCYDVEMYRAYPCIKDIDLTATYGHRPIFPTGVVDLPSTTAYVSRHYKLRSLEQARRKTRRIRPTKNEPNAHSHYLNFTQDADFFVRAERLHHYRFDHVWNFECVYDGNRNKAPFRKNGSRRQASD